MTYYDRDGSPMTHEQWIATYADREANKRVASDEIGDVLVSTVWLGIDHGWDGEPPLIFETMVFGGDLDQEMERYSTIDQAREGHRRWVERVRGDR